MRQLSHALLIASTWIAHLLHPGDLPISYELWHNLLRHNDPQQIAQNSKEDNPQNCCQEPRVE